MNEVSRREMEREENEMAMEMDTKDDYESTRHEQQQDNRLLPCPSGTRLVTMIHQYAQLHEEAAAVSSVTTEEKQRQLREASVWRLVSALWGSPSNSVGVETNHTNNTMHDITNAPALKELYDGDDDNDGNDGDEDSRSTLRRTRLYRRRLAVVAWLRETMDQSMSLATTAWDALSRLDVMSACDISLRKKNYKLASLITQSTGRQNFRTSKKFIISFFFFQISST